MFMEMVGSSLIEVLSIVAIVVGLIVPFLIFGLWWWAGMMACIGLVFGAFEITRWLMTGKTLSQNFWKWSEEHRAQAWFIIGTLAVAWLFLLLHLAWKMIK